MTDFRTTQAGTTLLSDVRHEFALAYVASSSAAGTPRSQLASRSDRPLSVLWVLQAEVFSNVMLPVAIATAQHEVAADNAATRACCG